VTEHYSTIYRHWLLANWRNIPPEQAQMMYLAGCALESRELDVIELKRELNAWRADQDASESPINSATPAAR
jgi:hypothetical protein